MAKRRPLTRSEVMSRVKRRDTTPERALRSALHAAGLRFRVDARVDGVSVDIVHRPSKVAIFVDGCFWHGCPEHCRRPKSNTSFWEPKISGNVDRDQHQTRKLESSGWHVIRVWEHNCQPVAAKTVDRILEAISARR